ncbi:unnamed protein product, partial [Mesorhabditis belari]|uniref:Uncharacterized protein n=1 Tax=Mesorhabditis belari TaxID=2138241 RepID=A0AAF3F4T1_9BILA
MLSTGHRCIIMWLHTLFILLVLVIYLDKDKDSKDPILLFGYLALSDVITVLGILANLVHKSLQRMSELAEARIHWINAVCVYKENFVYLLIVVLKWRNVHYNATCQFLTGKRKSIDISLILKPTGQFT